MCSNSQAALDQFIKDNEGNNEPCIISVRAALNDHNENCKQLNSDNKNTIIANFLLQQWNDLETDYRRALGGRQPNEPDYKGDENLRGYLGGSEWGGLTNDAPITMGGGFAICTQPIKYNRGVDQDNKPRELCGTFTSGSCDNWNNFERDHTSHWNCRYSMGLACTTNQDFNTGAVRAGYANLGTEMCFLQGMPVGSYYDNPQPPPALGHSTGYRDFIRERCGKKGCSPRKPEGIQSDLKCSVAGSRYTSKYWGSQLLECGYNSLGLKNRTDEFSQTRLARGKYLDRITKNATPAFLGVDNITLDDILDYYISKLNSAYPDINLTKDNIREHTGSIKNSAGFPEEGKKDDFWDADPNKLQAIKDDNEKAVGSDTLNLPNCCSNSITMGDDSHASLSDINQSCSFNSTTQTQTETQTETETQTQTHTQIQIQPQPQPENAPTQNPDPNEGFFSSIPVWVYIVGLVIIALFTLFTLLSD